ncbi:fatty acyl-AMP ligase [Actinomadura sp. NTSP31]|uniref:fatty acyl-AMP ligase n=1 Tax=Actinomadura sp. NTSP31 TaxID=1735447 RepID=UPI0035C0E788
MLGRTADAVQVLTDRVRARGDAPAVTVVSPDGDRSRSYAELDAHARSVARWLGRRGAAGDRVLLLYSAGLEFAAGLLGCLYAGMVAVPAPLPGHRGQVRRTGGIAEDAGVSFVLTDARSLPEVTSWTERDLPGVRTLAIDLVDAGDWEPVRADGSTLAVLQYTSGSTAAPKGVMISHGNLLHNAGELARAFRLDGDTRFGGWIPLYHDMGLFAHLVFPLLYGGSTVLMGQVAFLKRPHLWLEMISRFGLTFSAAPNFAFELCTRRVTDDQLAGIDLSGWRIAVNGSEPVRASVLAAFAERFARAGLRPETLTPAYGMAEATVFVSGAPERAPLVRRADPAALERFELREASGDGDGDRDGGGARELVSCGRVAAGLEVLVVHPETGEALPEGRIGEIWLRGGSVTSGYWRDAAASAEIFAEPGFLRTGDLGALVDGELYVTGRIKETLVIRGRNLYPQDIEHEVRRHHAELSSSVGAAFTVPGEGSDELVVTHEVRGRRVDVGELAGAVRETVVREFGVSPARVLLLRPGTVRRTTSGKIERATMRALFLAGRLSDARGDDQAPPR